jgi:hypothetical protein
VHSIRNHKLRHSIPRSDRAFLTSTCMEAERACGPKAGKAPGISHMGPALR